MSVDTSDGITGWGLALDHWERALSLVTSNKKMLQYLAKFQENLVQHIDRQYNSKYVVSKYNHVFVHFP
jgi:uncharacterized SAM-dependent methyltransferase